MHPTMGTMLRFFNLLMLPPIFLEIAAAGRPPSSGDVAGAIAPSARTESLEEVGGGAERPAEPNADAEALRFAECNDTAAHSDEPRRCDEEAPPASTTTGDGDDDPGRPADPGGPENRPRLRGRPPLKKGSIVELYAEGSYFATPAIVTGHDAEESPTSRSYELENVYTNERLPNVLAEFVHPYQVYEDGTRASCNVGYLEETYETPCAVVAHAKRKSGLVLYEVSYLDGDDDKLVRDYLPFSRVRRIHGRRNGSMIV